MTGIALPKTDVATGSSTSSENDLERRSDAIHLPLYSHRIQVHGSSDSISAFFDRFSMVVNVGEARKFRRIREISCRSLHITLYGRVSNSLRNHVP
jgi:hypothetical protein